MTIKGDFNIRQHTAVEFHFAKLKRCHMFSKAKWALFDHYKWVWLAVILYVKIGSFIR